MRFACKPDYEMSAARYAAFWEREIIDRPPVRIAFRKPDAVPQARHTYPDDKSRWLDIDTRVADAVWDMENTDFLYDSLPIVWPNFGPDILASWYGCNLRYGADTTWSSPVIKDWSDPLPRLDPMCETFRLTVEYTKKLIEAGRGKFIVGLTDLHPGGDLLAALRGPENFAFDLIEEPETVKGLLPQLMSEYYAAYGVFYRMLREAGMPITTWMPIVNEGTYYVPSNDFSCMVSTKMYEEFFLPEIVRECAFYEKSIYHLDGPGALRHLDAILSIKDLDAVQWCCGAGREGFDRWANVYKKIQEAGKSLHLACTVNELDHVFEVLRPEGVWFCELGGIENREQAEYAVKRIEKWK